MKKIIIILLFASGCSTTHVYNIKSSIDVTNDGLKEQSANNYKASQVDDTIPLPVDSVHFHEALIANPSYRKYLYV